MKKSLVLSVVCALLLCNCTSNSLFMDARPNGRSVQKLSLGVSVRGTAYDSTETLKLRATDASFLPIDAMYIGGLSDQSDFFIKYTAPITMTFGAKHSFDSPRYNQFHYSAIGASLGMDLVSLLKDSTDNDPLLYFDLRVPFYQTLSFSRYFNISVIPNAIMRVDYRYFQILAGGNANVRIGDKMGLMAEGSWLYNFRYREPEIQLGLNVFLPYGR